MKNKSFDLTPFVGLFCIFGLAVNIFNDDPIARVLAFGFLGLISHSYLVAKKK